jgi:hypothetical protein
MAAPSKRYRAVAAQLRSLPREHVDAAVKRMKAPATSALRRDAGGDSRLSGVRNGTPLRVQAGVKGVFLVEGFVAAGPRRARAQWFWMDKGTNPRGNHPGTRAKSTWSKAVDPEVEAAQADLRRRFVTIVRG